MRHSSIFATLALGAMACASSPSASTGAAPAARPAATASGAATAAATPAADNPCKDGGCKVTIQIEPAILRDLNEKRINFKALKGCPRDIGGDTPTAVRAVPPLGVSQVPLLVIPPFEGKYITLVYWFGSVPDKMAVIDFSKKKDVIIKAPYTQGSGGYMSDDVIQKQNEADVRRCHS